MPKQTLDELAETLLGQHTSYYTISTERLARLAFYYFHEVLADRPTIWLGNPTSIGKKKFVTEYIEPDDLMDWSEIDDDPEDPNHWKR